MKRIISSICVFALLAVPVMAQNNAGKADDGSRIAITPQVTDQEIPQAAKNLLLTKMKQICTKNGLAGDSENPFFIIDAKIDVLSKELTPTAPPMHALNMQVSLSIKDALTGNVYSETSIEIKGVGQNETKAYMAGLQNMNPANGQFKAMVDKGKEKILEFYNSQCDFVISKATALQKQGNIKDATKVLKSVPPVCKECYDKCMVILATLPVVADEPAATVTNSEATSGMSTNTGSYQVEIATDIFLTYRNSKVFGDKLTLYFDVENRGTNDFELKNYASNTRIMDQNGAEKKIEQLTVGGNSNPYYSATIIPGIVVKMECVFPVVDKVSMFEFKYNDKTFRIKEIMLNNSTTTNVAVTAPVAAAATTVAATPVAQPITQPAAPVASPMLIGDVVLAHFNGETDFYRKEYYPAKVQTLPSAATKGQTQLIVINSENPANTWTTDIITKWHKAAASELHDGSIVLYSSYELPDINSNYVPGVVVMTDELYKGIVSVKGWYGNVYKVSVTSIIIVDAPAYAGPAN